MPGLNGFETARLPRESPGGSGGLLAAIAGSGQEEHRASPPPQVSQSVTGDANLELSSTISRRW
jgi:hypothetical protein